ncbi:phosphate ABC transporter membrane protein 1, PhoT family [Leptolyngbyaceae cyanobacterium JSC-12]|nr:phosphate ABC transporter membrane protein 1, PhoT family [Leptolyngbyaceae cyanobacterium JSC-12]
MTSAVDNIPTMSYERTQAARTVDKGFKWLTTLFGFGVGIILLAIALQVARDALPAIQKFGIIDFVTGVRWNPVEDIFGAWTQIYGTLVTSFIALLLAVPVGLGVAIILSEDFLPPRIQKPLVFMVELLAAIPSVVYGLWGIFVLAPFLQGPMTLIHQVFGWIPLFSTPPTGRGIYIASIILAIMILPIIASISRDSLVGVNPSLRQAAYGLGATRWETLIQVIIPTAISGIIGGVMLALGRAMGETMAVTMLIGNANRPSPSIFAQGSTISALLANQFAEASGLQVASLMYAALILFGLTLLVNVLAEYIVSKVEIKKL